MRRVLPALALLLFAASSAVAGGRAFEIVGNVEIDRGDLVAAAKSDIARFRRTGELAAAEDVAFEMLILYRSEGYALADVTAELEENRLTIRIREGPRVLLGEVIVSGTEVGDPDDLAKFVDVPKTWFFGPRLFVVSDLRAAAERMRSWLREQGHLDAVVRGPLYADHAELADLEGDLVLDVGYEIEDGTPSRLDGIQLELDREVSFEREILKRIQRHVGKPYVPFRPFDLRATAAEVCGQHGHPFAVVEVEESFLQLEERVSVVVRVYVRPGPVTRIRRVDILGNVRTRERIVRRELGFAPNDIYDARAFRRSRKKLFDTHLFRQADLNVIAPAEEEELLEMKKATADVEVDLREAEFRRLEATIGFGSWELLRASVSYSWLNLWGTGRRLTLQLAGSYRGASFRVIGYQPWFLGLPHVDGLMEAKVERQERPSFTYDRISLVTTASKELLPKLTGSLSWSLSNTDTYDVRGDLPVEFENNVNISSFGAGLLYDHRDTAWAPRSGWLASGLGELADDLIGSEISFFRATGQGVRLIPLGDRYVIALRLSAGAIAPYGDTEQIPIQERFFLGGADTVRSFTTDNLGPRVISIDKNGNLVPTASASGGEFFSVANVEMRVPLHGPLQFALFVDAGNVIRKLNNAGFTDYRFAIGAGLRFITPIGPLRVDAGLNPSPKANEDQFAIFFAVGYPF